MLWLLTDNSWLRLVLGVTKGSCLPNISDGLMIPWSCVGESRRDEVWAIPESS